MSSPFFSAVVSLIVLLSFSCVPVEDPGGLTDPYESGLASQARLEGPPVTGEEAAAQADAAAATAAKEQAAEVQAASAAAAAAAAAAAEKASAAAALMAEEEAAVSAASQPASGGGEATESVSEIPSVPPGSDRAEALAPSGELARPPAGDSVPPDAQAGELAGTGAPSGEDLSEETPILVPPGDPEATPIPYPDPEPVPTEVGGAQAVPGLEVLPPAPESDSGALAAIDRAAVRPSPPAPDYTALAAVAVDRCVPSGFAAAPLQDLRLLQTWVDGTASRALLEGPTGETRTVVQGDVVGPTGARVSSIGAGEVVFAEIRFGMDDKPVLVQQRLRVAGPR